MNLGEFVLKLLDKSLKGEIQYARESLDRAEEMGILGMGKAVMKLGDKPSSTTDSEET